MSKITGFGETVEGYDIPVLNEREIRAAAGLLFVMMFVTIMQAGLQQNFTPIKYAIVIFLTDILVRVLVNPRFSPFLILGRLIVQNQVPEYVGAAPKKFAWKIGIVLAAAMFILMVVVNSYSPITGIICLVCLVFLFFETAFGICLGCKFYPLIYKQQPTLCPGGVCEPTVKQEIQKTSKVQILVVLGFAATMLLTAFVFHGNLSKKPYDLFGIEKKLQAR